MEKAKTHSPTLRILVHIAGWIPLIVLIFDFFNENLTVNPIQAIEQRTGKIALTFLMASLACTPLSVISGIKVLSKPKKALGNYGFLYACTHLITFFIIDYGLDLQAIWNDVSNKPYIIVGAIAFTLLFPLAFTSFKYWKKKLGKNWKRLHRLVYIISPLVVFHFFLVVKGSITTLQGDIIQPLIYGSIVLVLLILRIPKVKLFIINIRSKISRRLRAKNAASDKRIPITLEK